MSATEKALTRQLFCRLKGGTSYAHADLEAFFARWSPRFHFIGEGDCAVVTFQSIAEANEVISKVNRTSIGSKKIEITNKRSSRAMFINAVPLALEDKDAVAIARRVCSKYGTLEYVSIQEVRGSRVARVVFLKEIDCLEAVRNLQEHEENGWKWDLEFVAHRV